ncbi:sugar kinase [Actinomadura sp. HBU206391]|uniref:sugar kinase n=1 Tax=Actinomadura sp. HBU206391 TaxID=2731692 RepID=UPI0016506270|nr:sugar kinase [Actinomadura sp. HBU206391]MBC6461028.1 sugar kinase [Actinomadura sp. HBU206391]
MTDDNQESASGGRTPVLVAIGEGLLEVGVRDDLPPDYLGRGYGGDVANVAIMAARMGTKARLLTRLGADAPGTLLMDYWRRSGLDVSRIAVDDSAPTGVYVNAVGFGEHRFHYYRSNSAATLLSEEDVDGRLLDDADALHVSGISLAISDSAARAAERAARLARERGIPVTFCVNHRPALRPDTGRGVEFARAATIVIMSGEDARGLFGTDRPERIRTALGPEPQEIVLTDGAAGATVLTADHAYRVTAPPVEVVDTAGAGDALAGTYMAGRLAGAGPREALEQAVIAGSLSCRRTGCARSYPTVAEINEAQLNQAHSA